MLRFKRQDSYWLAPGWSWCIAVLLAGLHWFLAVSSSRHNCTTFDEVAHIGGGLGQVLFGDFRLNPENGVLPQTVAATAMVIGGVRFPEISDPHTLEGASWLYSDAWELGYRTLYQVGNDPEYVLLLGRAASALSGALTVLLVHAVARHIHRGTVLGTLLPTLLATFCPTMLAHGALITSDGWFTFFLGLSPVCILTMLNALADFTGSASVKKELACVGWSLLAGVAVGGVLVSKHSGVMIAPVAVTLLLLRILTFRGPVLRFLLRLLVNIAVAVAVSYMVLWGFYRGRYTAFSHGECIQWRSNWEAGLGSNHGRLSGVPAELVATARRHRLLPEGMLFGLSYAYLSTHARAAFLAGRHGSSGWRLFFPYAVAVKTPAAVLALVLLALLLSLIPPPTPPKPPSSTNHSKVAPTAGAAGEQRGGAAERKEKGGQGDQGGRGSPPPPPPSCANYGAVLPPAAGAAANGNGRQEDREADLRDEVGWRKVARWDETAWYRLSGLGVPFLLYWFVAVNQNLNIGHRHMLPTYPFLYVLSGFVGRAHYLPGLAGRAVRFVCVCVAAAAVWEVTCVHPHYLAFFNRFGGGPRGGYRHLVDSSLDWGQALPALRDFMRQEALARNASAFPVPNVDPNRRDPRLKLYVSYFGLGSPAAFGVKDDDFWTVRHVYSSVSGVSRPKHIQGNWNGHYEGLYRRQARLVRRLLSVREPLRSALIAGQVRELHDMPKLLSWFDGFRLGRLCAFFRQGDPYAQAGYAMNIYHVDAAHLRRWLFGPPPAETYRNDISFLRVALR